MNDERPTADCVLPSILHVFFKCGMIRPRQKIASRNVSYTLMSDYLLEMDLVICLDLIQTETERMLNHFLQCL